jgi:hypothetical protein
MRNASLQTFIHAAGAREVRLPETQPLTLTRNFALVVAACFASLVTAPFVFAWAASLFLK